MAGEAGCYVNASVSASVCCHMTSSSLCLTPRVCCIHLHAGVLSQRARPSLSLDWLSVSSCSKGVFPPTVTVTHPREV